MENELRKKLGKNKWSIATQGILVGVLAGLFSVLYRIVIREALKASKGIYAYLASTPLMILPFLLLIVTFGLMVGYLIKNEPMASSSGIPQTKGIILYGLYIEPIKTLVVRFLGGALAVLFGLSVGREGPSIHIGASAGKIVSKGLDSNAVETKCLVTGGAAAGLAAAFNAPISGILFTLEEIHRSFSSVVLLTATSAALSADFVSKVIFGLKPVLMFLPLKELPLSYYALLIPVGIISGIAGILINKCFLGFQKLFKKLPITFRPILSFLIALPVGLFLPSLLGGGDELIHLSELQSTPLKVLAILFLGKLLFTSTSFASGVPGGIFLPILSIGALFAGTLGKVFLYFGLPADLLPFIAIAGMAGALGATVKAPLTAVLLTAEMTGSLVHLLPVALCVFVALFVSDKLKNPAIYDVLLDRYLETNGKRLTLGRRGAIQGLIVEVGSAIENKELKNISIPKGDLIIELRRNDEEMIPKGDTRILAGDYLVVLLQDDEKRGKDRWMELTKSSFEVL
ncbi:ClC family H(+)/Cl(-) exchange transporter [Guggenheimella bovis]